MPQKKKTFLKLYRKPGQRIIVGDPPNHITLTVGTTNHFGTELEFLAPASTAIDREEIAQKKGRIGNPNDISNAY